MPVTVRLLRSRAVVAAPQWAVMRRPSVFTRGRTAALQLYPQLISPQRRGISTADLLSHEEQDLIAQLVQSCRTHRTVASRTTQPSDPHIAEDDLLKDSEGCIDDEDAGDEDEPISVLTSSDTPVEDAVTHIFSEVPLAQPLLHPPTRYVALFPRHWLCEACGRTNPDPTTRDGPSGADHAHPARKFFCSHCSAPFPGVQDWVCTSCHCVNPRAAASCGACSADKAVSWTCAGCGTLNATSRHMCRQCRVPLATKTTTKPSEALESTVLCAQCGTLNASQWDLCSCCLAPLPRLTATVARVGATPEPSSKLAEEISPARTEDDVLADYVVPSGSWRCVQCNVLQRRNASFCDICLRPREVASGKAYRTDDTTAAAEVASRAAGGAVGDPLSGDWQCAYCRQFRTVRTLTCCDHERQVPQGYWLCRRCFSTNRSDRVVCLGCGSQPDVGPWCCTVCATPNDEGHFDCTACGASHPLLWRCDGCHDVMSVVAATCTTCGTARRLPPSPVVCHVCKAPNVRTRRACFRCRARLAAEDWCCPLCRHQGNTRGRCDNCHAAKTYNLDEETWVCELCETAVVSGGDLPVLTQCPFCSAPRAVSGAGDLAYPSRWVCGGCGLFNRAASAQCVECGTQRALQPFHSTATCPHCFRQTPLDEREACAHCGDSLSDVLSESLLSVSLETSPLSELGRLAEEQMASA